MPFNATLILGLVGVGERGRQLLLLDGLMSGGQHAADPFLYLADGAETETQTEVLFKLLLYIADILMKLITFAG